MILTMLVVVAIPGAVLAALWRGRGRWLLLVAGAVFLCVPAAGVANADLGHLGSLSTLRWVGVGAATGGVFVAILALPWVALRIIASLDRKAPTGATSSSRRSEQLLRPPVNNGSEVDRPAPKGCAGHRLIGNPDAR